VVLLPSAPVARRAIAASRRLKSDVRLGPRALPHVTLAMAAVRRDDLPALTGALQSLARTRRAPRLRILRTVAVPGRGHPKAWYVLPRTGPLLRLHRAAWRALLPHRRASASLPRYVRRFEAYSGARYRPHITLGHGRPAPERGLPWRFRPAALALCQLGDHCTCARLLWKSRFAAGLTARCSPTRSC
jgi:2'-5' RNA ligase